MKKQALIFLLLTFVGLSLSWAEKRESHVSSQDLIRKMAQIKKEKMLIITDGAQCAAYSEFQKDELQNYLTALKLESLKSQLVSLNYEKAVNSWRVDLYEGDISFERSAYMFGLLAATTKAAKGNLGIGILGGFAVMLAEFANSYDITSLKSANESLFDSVNFTELNQLRQLNQVGQVQTFFSYSTEIFSTIKSAEDYLLPKVTEAKNELYSRLESRFWEDFGTDEVNLFGRSRQLSIMSGLMQLDKVLKAYYWNKALLFEKEYKQLAKKTGCYLLEY